MALIWYEIILIVGLNAAILAGILTMFIKVGAPKLLSKAEVWMGGAIGRFMANLTEAAEQEGADSSSSTSPGTLKLGGFQIDVATIKQLMPLIPQLVQLAQMFGFVSGTPSKGGAAKNPFGGP